MEIRKYLKRKYYRSHASEVETPVRCRHGGGKRPLVGEVVHHGQHVIVGERLPAHGHHGDVSLGRVKPADVVILPVVALVGVLGLGDNPEQGGVGVGQGLHRAHAAPGAATLQRVGSAAGMSKKSRLRNNIQCFVFCSPDHVLGGELQKVVVHVVDLGVGGHSGTGGEGPAAVAHALVSDLSDDPLVPPVHRLGQVLQSDLLSPRNGEVGVDQGARVEATTGVCGNKLLPLYRN